MTRLDDLYYSIMTNEERDRIEQRMRIALALKEGWTYKEIVNQIVTSSATIAKVKKIMKENEKYN